MFSFRSDKVGFFVTIILLGLLAAAVTSTVCVLLAGGVAELWAVKLTWGIWWVLCIITVLIRIALFRWQMMRRQMPPGLQPPDGAGPSPGPGPSGQTGPGERDGTEGPGDSGPPPGQGPDGRPDGEPRQHADASVRLPEHPKPSTATQEKPSNL